MTHRTDALFGHFYVDCRFLLLCAVLPACGCHFINIAIIVSTLPFLEGTVTTISIITNGYEGRESFKKEM